MYTTPEKVRVEAGFQHRFSRQAFKNSPNSSSTKFYVKSEDPIKLVPEFMNGNTTSGVSDVQVFLGLSGINGISQLVVSSVNSLEGSIVLNTAPPTGSSLVISYASSPITDIDTLTVIAEAEAMLNQRLASFYYIPIGASCSIITQLATQLAAARLMIREFGIGSKDTASDGYALYNLLMGDPKDPTSGEIGRITMPDYTLIDDSGNVIPRKDGANIIGAGDFITGGRVNGRIFDITEEQFRLKQSQLDVNTRQAGSGNQEYPNEQW
jgi:hypothetical protein